MRRRDFIALAGAAATLPRAAFAQQAVKLPRVVVFTAISLQSGASDGLKKGFSDRGLVVALEYQVAPTTGDLPAFAARIVAEGPDIVICVGGAAALAMQMATTKIPVLFTTVGDPEGLGLVASLAHPGANITGVSGAMNETATRQVAILRELVPAAKRVAILYLASAASNVLNAEHLRMAAMAAGLDPVMIGLVDTQALPPQFERVLSADVQGVLVTTSVYTDPDDNRDLLWELLVKAKLPAISQVYYRTGMHPVGGMVSYGANFEAQHEQVAADVESILKGVKPADIPVQLPNVFDFVLDMKAARAIGITIPPSVLIQATLVIE